MSLILFHGGPQIVKSPEIRATGFPKDFGWGFYCTNNKSQATRWAVRGGAGYVSSYSCCFPRDLKILRFPQINRQWLDFIAHCRNGGSHDYDVVEGAMADDTVWNYTNAYLSGEITEEAFFVLARFRHPTHQVCFHTEKALTSLSFLEGAEVYGQ